MFPFEIPVSTSDIVEETFGCDLSFSLQPFMGIEARNTRGRFLLSVLVRSFGVAAWIYAKSSSSIRISDSD